MAHEYSIEYQSSVNDPASFWLRASENISWHRRPTRALEVRDGRSIWFGDGELNTCFNAIDRHVEDGRGEDVALIYESSMTDLSVKYSFADLRDRVAHVAGMILDNGVTSGDRVLIYMPMVPEAVFAMLACSRVGAVHSVVFGGFAAHELAKRIDDAQPTLVLSASCGIEPGRVVAYKPLLDEAIQIASHAVPRCIILQRPQLEASLHEGRDCDWTKALALAQHVECIPVPADHPLYILYTSGTTGVPKGVVRDNGGHAVALAWSMANIYGMSPGEVFWAASDVGWVVGHSYIVYGPLISGCATVLYEGKPVGTPDAGAFWRIVRKHDVRVLFAAPTALRAIKREDPGLREAREQGTGMLRAVFLAGERADPDTIEWAEAGLGVPVIDHWWQTELGWPATASCVGLGDNRRRLGSAGRPVPGYRFAVLNATHAAVGPGSLGDIAIEMPLPPGCLSTLWNKHLEYRQSYLVAHPGYYTTGDAGFIDEDGFVHVMSRTDDIINVAGHRLSTGSIEQIIAKHADIAECAVIGIPDPIKGMVPLALFVLKSGVTRSTDKIVTDVIHQVRGELGPVASFKLATVVRDLPKTRSGKVLRGVVRRLAVGEPPAPPATLDNPESLEEVRAALSAVGVGEV